MAGHLYFQLSLLSFEFYIDFYSGHLSVGYSIFACMKKPVKWVVLIAYAVLLSLFLAYFHYMFVSGMSPLLGNAVMVFTLVLIGLGL